MEEIFLEHLVLVAVLMKKNYNYKGLMKQSFSYMCRALHSGTKLNQVKQDIRDLVNSYTGLTRNERYELYRAIYEVHRACYFSDDKDKTLSYRKNYDKVLSAARRVYMKERLRGKKGIIRAHLNNGKTIFFLCSSHNNPAEDHKDFENKVYIDRFWRNKVEGIQYSAVLDFIKKNDVVTVQEIMGEPVWLTTRPFCKHFFIPMNTEDVLGSTVLSELKEMYHAKSRVELYDDTDYYELRNKVYERLNRIAPCKYYEQKIREI